ncbi:MAG: hypothetical protein SNJ71_04210, partial [Bacteroidales bacterium]
GSVWTTFTAAAPANSENSTFVSISPDSKTIFWSAANQLPAFSKDNGNTWTVTNDIVKGLRIKSDRVNSSVFYAAKASTGEFFISTNGGVSFMPTIGTFPATSAVDILPVFGKEGCVWIAAREKGLFYTSNGGTTITKINSVISAQRVAVGKAKQANNDPTVFVYGKIGEYTGLFKSDDGGQTWIKINNKLQEYSRNYTAMCGDPKIYGRLYIGIHGRGIMYGDVQPSECKAPLLPTTLTICKTSFSTLSTGINSSEYNFKWKKDNETINSNTNSLQISKPGLYSVTVTKPGCTPAIDFIEVKSLMPLVEDVNVCKGSTTELKAINVSEYIWYNSQMQQIGTGQTVTITPETTSFYYLKDVKTTEYSLGLPEYTSGGWNVGSLFDNNQNKTKVSVTNSLRIKSVALHVNSNNTNAVVRIVDDQNNVIKTVSKSALSRGKQVIELNTLLDPGTYLIDAVGTVGNVQFQNVKGAAIMNLENFVTIEHAAGWGYGIFYDIRFETGNICEATPINVTVNTPEAITINYQINNKAWAKGTTINLCSNDRLQLAAWPLNGSTWQWIGPAGYSSTLRTPLIVNFPDSLFGTYTVTHIDTNACSATSSLKIIKANNCINTQIIALKEGWNLISINIRSEDSTITSLFKGLDVNVIKNMDYFWKKTNPSFLNTLKTITAGQGYLINMNTSGTLFITGIPMVETQNFTSLKIGWNLIGCPFQKPIPFSQYFNATNCKQIKNFDGFWTPNGTINSIQNFEAGKGYFFMR